MQCPLNSFVYRSRHLVLRTGIVFHGHPTASLGFYAFHRPLDLQLFYWWWPCWGDIFLLDHVDLASGDGSTKIFNFSGQISLATPQAEFLLLSDVE